MSSRLHLSLLHLPDFPRGGLLALLARSWGGRGSGPADLVCFVTRIRRSFWKTLKADDRLRQRRVLLFVWTQDMPMVIGAATGGKILQFFWSQRFPLLTLKEDFCILLHLQLLYLGLLPRIALVASRGLESVCSRFYTLVGVSMISDMHFQSVGPIGDKRRRNPWLSSYKTALSLVENLKPDWVQGCLQPQSCSKTEADVLGRPPFMTIQMCAESVERNVWRTGLTMILGPWPSIRRTQSP